MRMPIEEYKLCPHCGRLLGPIAYSKRLQKKLVKCMWCKKLIAADVKKY